MMPSPPRREFYTGCCCTLWGMDSQLKGRVVRVITSARGLGQALRLTGWSTWVSQEARRLKREDPLGPLASELDGWEQVRRVIPDADIQVFQPVENQPLAGASGRYVSAMIPLLDMLIRAGDHYEKSLKARERGPYPGSPDSGMSRAEANEIGGRMVELAEGLREAIHQHWPDEEQGTEEMCFDWAHQAELIRAANQVLGAGSLNKGVVSKACSGKGLPNGPQIETSEVSDGRTLVKVASFLRWVEDRRDLGHDEVTQVHNAVIGEIVRRKPG